MRPAFITLTALLAVLIATPHGRAQSTASATTNEPAKIEWLRYDVGLEKAKKEGKLILIDFTASWCGWCKRMDRETFSEPQVAGYILQTYVPIKVWGDDTTKAGMVNHKGQMVTQATLARAYSVRAYPTFWFLDSGGGQIGPQPGFRSAKDFLPLIEYVGGSHYKTMSYENFLKKRAG